MATVNFDPQNVGYTQKKLNNKIQQQQQESKVQNAEVTRTQNTSETVKTAKTGQAAQLANTDAVSLTDTAKKLNKAQEKAKESSGIDTNKVAYIKNAIKNGSYHIDYQKLASNLVASETELSSIFG